MKVVSFLFARERCWIDEPLSEQEAADHLAADADMKSIEDIINQIADDTIDSGFAAQALRMLV